MKTIWKDYNHKDGEQVYETRDKALEVIRDIFKYDDSLRERRTVKDLSDDDLFEIGYNFYGIEAVEVEPTPCCDKQDLKFGYEGDGVEWEQWTCANCETHYTVPIEIVRDWDNIEEIN